MVVGIIVILGVFRKKNISNQTRLLPSFIINIYIKHSVTDTRINQGRECSSFRDLGSMKYPLGPFNFPPVVAYTIILYTNSIIYKIVLLVPGSRPPGARPLYSNGSETFKNALRARIAAARCYTIKTFFFFFFF